MVDLLAGAALGAAFGELLKAILDEANHVSSFKSSFRRLRSTITGMSPTIEKMVLMNQRLDRPEDLKILIDRMKEGKDLICKCSSISRFDFYKKASYSRKLQKLEKMISKFIQLDMQLHQARDQKEILLEVKDMRLAITRLSLKDNDGVGICEMEDTGMCPAPAPSHFSVGLDVPLKELKMELFEGGRSVIVVSAPGGYGKTTLVEKLCQDDEIKVKFRDILFVTFSKTPDIEVIVQTLFKHKGWVTPDLQDEKDAFSQLRQLVRRIGQYPILLVLDDVWCNSESLLDQFVFQLPQNYRVLVTSRFNFPKFGPPYHLKPLNYEDAKNLFRHSAFPQNADFYLREDISEKILKACNGCPLALQMIGRSLCGQPLAIWKSQLLKWCKDESILDSNISLRNCLQSSIDVLDVVDTKLKECYLDMGSFLEDQKIPASALIDIWVELYELDEDGVHAMANLHKLFSQNLLKLISLGKEETEEDGFYNEHFVTQLDLFRELAILQSSSEPVERRKRLITYIRQNKFPEWWLGQKQPISARLFSIFTDEGFLSRWHDIQLPEVEALVLNFQSQNYRLPEFLEKMDKLKVLVATNYGSLPTEVSNFSIVGSLSNLKRIRLEKISIPSLSMNSQLKNLQKISFVMCDINEAFQNCPINISDAFPNLLEIDIDCCDDMKEFPDGFCDIIQLRKLSITNCNKLSTLPDCIGNLVNLETLRLNSCIDLLELPGTIGKLTKLKHLNISDCMSMEKLPTQIGELRSLRKLLMMNCTECELPQAMVKLQQIEVVCDEETAFSWTGFKNLQIRVVEEDRNLNWL